MYSGAGQQGKGTDSCSEIKELHKKLNNKQKLNTHTHVSSEKMKTDTMSTIKFCTVM